MGAAPGDGKGKGGRAGEGRGRGQRGNRNSDHTEGSAASSSIVSDAPSFLLPSPPPSHVICSPTGNQQQQQGGNRLPHSNPTSGNSVAIRDVSHQDSSAAPSNSTQNKPTYNSKKLDKHHQKDRSVRKQFQGGNGLG